MWCRGLSPLSPAGCWLLPGHRLVAGPHSLGFLTRGGLSVAGFLTRRLGAAKAGSRPTQRRLKTPCDLALESLQRLWCHILLDTVKSQTHPESRTWSMDLPYPPSSRQEKSQTLGDPLLLSCHRLPTVNLKFGLWSFPRSHPSGDVSLLLGSAIITSVFRPENPVTPSSVSSSLVSCLLDVLFYHCSHQTHRTTAAEPRMYSAQSTSPVSVPREKCVHFNLSVSSNSQGARYPRKV